MRKSYGIFLFACLLVAPPVFAGDLTFSGGQTAWHSTQCAKPNPPASVLNADRETSGDDMNALIGQHNVYVDAAQSYMNCISSEATRDQVVVDQQIAAAAQAAIANMKGEIDSEAQALRIRQQK